MIEKSCIDEILRRINIVDVVNSRVDLKKIGKNHHARCPFHDEKTPSFTVAEHKQMFYCFGCGAAGDAIGFLVKYDNLNFVEAVKSLAVNCGVDIDDSNHRAVAPRAIIEQYKEDSAIVKIYEYDSSEEKNINYEDKKRYRLAVARIKGIEDKFGFFNA